MVGLKIYKYKSTNQIHVSEHGISYSLDQGCRLFHSAEIHRHSNLQRGVVIKMAQAICICSNAIVKMHPAWEV